MSFASTDSASLEELWRLGMKRARVPSDGGIRITGLIVAAVAVQMMLNGPGEWLAPTAV